MIRRKFVSIAVCAAALTYLMGGCGASDGSSALSAASAVDAPTGTSLSEASGEAESAEVKEVLELTVFAAASMTETLEELAKQYEAQHPNISISVNFDSSGTLKTQIEEGADCDIFISAGQKQMDQLDKNADAEINTDGLDFIAEGTRFDLLENKVVLCTSEGSTAKITSFDSWAEAMEHDDQILFAMGNSDVPVGQYTQKIFAYYGLDEEALANAGKITYGTNVKEVTTQILESSVDAGVVYCTDAYSAGLTPIDYATKEMCGQVIYPAAILTASKHQEEAQAFLDYLTTDESMAVFEAVGFSKVA